MKKRSKFEEESHIPKSCSPIDLPEYQYEAMNYETPTRRRFYVAMCLVMVVFGAVLFASAYELVRVQETAQDIIGMMCIGLMGSVMIAMGIFGLWETWRKQL